MTKLTKYGYFSYYLNDYWFCKYLSEGLIYDQDVFQSKLLPYIQNCKNIIDVGAHCGSYSIMMKKNLPDCKIICFEAQKKMYQLLKENLRNETDMTFYNYALGDKERICEMDLKTNDGPNTDKPVNFEEELIFNLGGLQIGKDGEKVQMKTLDSFMIENCDFIKIDVEGFEPYVILGGIDLIKRCKPLIYFEYNHKQISQEILEKYNLNKVDIFELLKDIGYTQLIRMDGNDINFLAIY